MKIYNAHAYICMKIMSTRCGGSYMQTKRNQQIHTYTHTHSRHTDNANTLRSQLNFYSTPQTKRIPAYLVRENESIFSCNFNWIDATECSRAVYIPYTLRVWITVDVALGFAWLVFWLWRNIGLTNWIDMRILSTEQISRCWKNTAQSCGWLSVHFFFTLACISNLFKR